MAQATPTSLVRGIGRWDLVALGVNFIVGAGIFGLPGKVYSISGSASLIAYVLCALAVTLIILCFAEVGSRFDVTGGPYLYAREACGPLIGFEVGWLRWVSGVTTFAANCTLLVDYLSYLCPAANAGVWRAVVITTAILLLTTINVLGVREGAVASNILAVAKLLPLLLFIAVGFFFVTPQNFSITTRPSYSALSTSALLLVFTFTGFESIPIPAGEVRDPQRSVPFALLTTMGIVTVVYILIQFVCIGTLPGLANSTRPLADAGSRFLGIAGGYIITAGAIVSITGNLIGQLLVTPRIIFAMAERRQLPQTVAAVHARFRTPYIAILVSAAVILGLALSGTFIQLVTISVMARLTVYGATCAALPILRHKANVRPPTFKVPGGMATAVAAMLVCIWLLSSCTKREALNAVIAAAVGVAIYYIHKMRKTDDRSDRGPAPEDVM